MKTIEERAIKYAEDVIGYIPSGDDGRVYVDYLLLRNAYIRGATEQKAIDEANPSDTLIMRVLNAIGYEEESWVHFVREHLKAMEE